MKHENSYKFAIEKTKKILSLKWTISIIILIIQMAKVHKTFIFPKNWRKKKNREKWNWTPLSIVYSCSKSLSKKILHKNQKLKLNHSESKCTHLKFYWKWIRWNENMFFLVENLVRERESWKLEYLRGLEMFGYGKIPL